MMKIFIGTLTTREYRPADNGKRMFSNLFFFPKKCLQARSVFANANVLYTLFITLHCMHREFRSYRLIKRRVVEDHRGNNF